jgi:hypothetical protein
VYVDKTPHLSIYFASSLSLSKYKPNEIEANLRIRRMKLKDNTVWVLRIGRMQEDENNPRNSKQKSKIFQKLVRSSDGFFWAKQCKQKKNLMQEYL